MKRFSLCLFLAFSGILSAQEFEIPAEKYPFYDIVEWKGYGAILYNREPEMKLKQVHMTLVGTDMKSAWQQSFNPLSENYYYIADDGGRYAYFLNDLELKDGKISFNQLNVSGNIRTQAVGVITLIRKLGDFQLSDLTVTDIVSTEKALVYTLIHSDKATDTRTTIAVTMTHHNLSPYASIVATNKIGSSKPEDQVSWYVAGQEGESIIFAARIHDGKSAGWATKQFSPKGVLESESELKFPEQKFVSHYRSGFGPKGNTMLQEIQPREAGTLVYCKGKFYVGGIEADGTGAKMVSYVYDAKSWKKIGATPLGAYNAKRTGDVGFFQLAEGLAWYNGNEKTGEAHFHAYDGSKQLVTKNVPVRLNNPGRLVTEEFPGKFIAALPTGTLVFDPAQLPANGAAKFTLIRK